MTVKILRAHELTMLIYVGDQLSKITPGKIDVSKKIKHLIAGTDWNRQILKGEKWADLFCGSILGLSALYFGVVCVKMLFR